MKLDDFLKCKKVKCVQAFGFHSTLTVGKVYDVKGLSERHVHICNDANNVIGYEFSLFEPVTDLPKSAENPLQNIELTPEFEAVEPILADNSVNIQDIGTDILDTNADIKDKPKFKVGDPVYFPRLSNKLCVIGEGQEDDYVDEVNGSKALAEMQSDLDFVYDQKTNSWLWDEKDCAPQLLHATPESHALLSKLYPHIEFEQPPQPLSGDALVKAMLTKGIKNVLCLWGNGDKIIIDRLDYKGSLMSADCRVVGGLTPIDWVTDEPLTEAVLDE